MHPVLLLVIISEAAVYCASVQSSVNSPSIVSELRTVPLHSKVLKDTYPNIRVYCAVENGETNSHTLVLSRALHRTRRNAVLPPFSALRRVLSSKMNSKNRVQRWSPSIIPNVFMHLIPKKKVFRSEHHKHPMIKTPNNIPKIHFASKNKMSMRNKLNRQSPGAWARSSHFKNGVPDSKKSVPPIDFGDGLTITSKDYNKFMRPNINTESPSHRNTITATDPLNVQNDAHQTHNNQPLSAESPHFIETAVPVHLQNSAQSNAATSYEFETDVSEPISANKSDGMTENTFGRKIPSNNLNTQNPTTEIYEVSSKSDLFTNDGNSGLNDVTNHAISDLSPETNYGSKQKYPSAVEEVIWGKLCSPRYVIAGRYRDSVLQCEVWAPEGTVITWKREGLSVRVETIGKHSATNSNKREIISKTSGKLEINKRHDDSAFDRINMNVLSTHFLDCASYGEKGEYEIEVRTPSGQKRARFFNVQIYDECMGDPDFETCSSLVAGQMCALTPEERLYVPRIHSWTKAMYANYGSTAVLACHYIGEMMMVLWTFEERTLDFEHEITSAGELIIPSVNDTHSGFYRCILASEVLPVMYHDTVLISLQVTNSPSRKDNNYAATSSTESEHFDSFK